MNAIERIVGLLVTHSLQAIILLSVSTIKSFHHFLGHVFLFDGQTPFLWSDLELAFVRSSDQFVSVHTIGLSPRDLVNSCERQSKSQIKSCVESCAAIDSMSTGF